MFTFYEITLFSLVKHINEKFVFYLLKRSLGLTSINNKQNRLQLLFYDLTNEVYRVYILCSFKTLYLRF